MKYMGHVYTGEVFAASNYHLLYPNGPKKEDEIIFGTVVEITGNQKGEYKAILRRKNPKDGKYDFKAFSTRQISEVLKYKEEFGWEIRKDFSNKTTYDEYPFLGQIPNSIEGKKQKK